MVPFPRRAATVLQATGVVLIVVGDALYVGTRGMVSSGLCLGLVCAGACLAVTGMVDAGRRRRRSRRPL